MPSPWCVKHRDGWCATADGKQHDEAATSVATRCGWFVLFPFGSERRGRVPPGWEPRQIWGVTSPSSTSTVAKKCRRCMIVQHLHQSADHRRRRSGITDTEEKK